MQTLHTIREKPLQNKFIIVFCLFSFLSFGQSTLYTKTVLKDDIKQVQTFTRDDSTLVRILIFKLDTISNKFLCIQDVTFNNEGSIKRVETKPERKFVKSKLGGEDIIYEEFFVDIGTDGRVDKLLITNNFKIFRVYKYLRDQKKYKRSKY